MTSTGRQKRLVITGATGMLGGYALWYPPDHPTVRGATALGRTRQPSEHAKLKEVPYQDFAGCAALATTRSLSKTQRCLRAYTAAVPNPALRRITVD